MRVFLGRANSTGSGLCGAASPPCSMCGGVGAARGSWGTLSWQSGHCQSSGGIKGPESAPLNPLQGAHPPFETVWATRRGGSRLPEGPEADVPTSSGNICSAGAFS